MTHHDGREDKTSTGRHGGPLIVHDGGGEVPAAGMTVLLIDSDVVFRDALTTALDRFGVTVLWRARILGLLDAVADSEPDAVVLSADLPGGDALELIRAIRQQGAWTSLPVFVVASEVARPFELRAYAEGADAVLPRERATSEIAARLIGQAAVAARRRSGAAKSIADAALALCVNPESSGQTSAEVAARVAPPTGPEPSYGHSMGAPPNGTPTPSPFQLAPQYPGYPMLPGQPMYVLPPGYAPQAPSYALQAPSYPPHAQAYPTQPSHAPPHPPQATPSTPGQFSTPTQQMPQHTAAHAPPNGQFVPPQGAASPPATVPTPSGLGAEYRGAPPPSPGDRATGAPASAASVPDVVVVEDDPSLLEMLRYALTNRGYSTLSFSNGLDALRALREMDTAGSRPVVLLDVDLPGLDGFRILHELTGARPGVFQVILCTVHSSEATQVLGIQSGALDYLVKPLRMPIVLAKVERLLGRGGLAAAAGLPGA